MKMVMQKFKDMKSEVDADWKKSGGMKGQFLKFFVFSARWVFTAILIYAVSLTTIAYLVPFTASYLAGSAKIVGATDLVSSLTLWIFPSMAATIMLSALCLVIDYQIYKFFKKHMCFKTSSATQSEAEVPSGKITSIKPMKPLKRGF